MTTKTFSVPEVHCDHCVASIEGAVGALDGVQTVAVDLKGKMVEISFEESQLSEPEITAAIEGQGYDVAPA